MKRFLSGLLFASAVAFVPGTSASAADIVQETGAASAPEITIEVTVTDEMAIIDGDASTRAGEAVVIDKIVKEFGVDASVVKDLRARRLGYGEITLALSLAERLPGGLTPENLDRVMEARLGPPVQGWGNVARSFDLSLKPSQRRLEKVGEAGAVKERARHEKAEKVARAERAGKRERIERVERVERPVKPERVERPERPDRGGRK